MRVQFACLVAVLVGPLWGHCKDAATWHAGVATVVITPRDSLWMAGYAARNRPSEGKTQELYAKALALKDADGNRLVIVTTDLIGIPRTLRDAVAKQVLAEYQLPAAGLLLNASHTHCGPVVRSGGSVLYDLEPEQSKRVAQYVVDLQTKMVQVIGRALADLKPATLAYSHARAGFAMNRRLPGAKGPVNSPFPDGPIDHEVPVLRVDGPDGKLRAVLFGYACHNTTLAFYQFCGDYAGYAQEYLEKDHPGVTALFFMGCGGDQNPYPRGTLPQAQQHGRSLANAVEAALLPQAKPVRGPLRSALEEVTLDFVPLSREELVQMKDSKDIVDRKRAALLLTELESAGKINGRYAYPIQVVQFGGDLTLVGLAGETVVDYALRLKRELAGNTVWVAGYTNDVFGYVPSLRVLKEGGYEGGGAMRYTRLPGPFAPSVEERIVGKVHEMVRQARRIGLQPVRPKMPTYVDHQDLTYFLDADGRKVPIKSSADWDHRRRHILANMQLAMGDLASPSVRSRLDVKVLEEVNVGELARRKLTFQSESGHHVPAYLFLPAAAKGRKAAAVLCLHQTTRLGSGEPAGLGGSPNLHYALHLAQRGFVTLAPDYPSFGEHKWNFDAHTRYASGTMKAIWDNIRAVDLLQSLPEVDPERIGVIGHSLGGHNAMFTAVFEPRLKVIVSSCGFTSFVKDDMPSWTGKVYMPRIAKVYGNDAKRMPFDFPEVVASFAPRPFLACAATKDDDFDVSGVRDCIAAARPVYALFDKQDSLRSIYPESKHDFPAEAQKAAYEFIERHLKAKRAVE